MTDGYDMEATIRSLSNKLRLSESLKEGYMVAANELKSENEQLRELLQCWYDVFQNSNDFRPDVPFVINTRRILGKPKPTTV